MVSVLAYSKREHDISDLWGLSKDLIAGLSEDHWKCRQIVKLDELRSYLEDGPLVHLIIYDIRDRDSLEFLPCVRKKYPLVHLMLLADVTVSPMEYIRPGVQASSLLLKPWSREQAGEVLRGFLSEYIGFAEREKTGGAEALCRGDKGRNPPYPL